MLKFDLQEYLTENGQSPFNTWLLGLRDIRARARVRTRLDRVRLGNLGDYASVGDGVFELRIFYGPGYRVYYSQEADNLMLLLIGGTKDTQRRDIRTAREYLVDYRRRESDD
ncbi:MAG: type II toxin-antitoxin system RelE/ParE family toxin [Xanthomonadales bacterium]|nr:type II toxin-antitoxin system RelE/ParE family toxin [Xanthomonadales bacterium]